MLSTGRQVGLYGPSSSETQIDRCRGGVPELRGCQRSKIKAAKTTLPGLKEDLKCVLEDEQEKEK